METDGSRSNAPSSLSDMVRAEAPTVGFYRYLYNTTGADYVSVGALTHSAPAVDISFEIEPA